ncbi:MFS general substrate transporter [Artomyces pyxidatus]|uniref:MFS general substrate transporter n=1 Tax=Artomyces pyxidatus TaxID=48021 RepID=A0ACB8T8S0_9AGAM|nr:MFS general substrate transporter [Artomyces pyxidatus]
MAFFLISKLIKHLKSRDSPSPAPTSTSVTRSQSRNDAEAGRGLPAERDIGYRAILTIALIIPVLLETLDYTIVATAQPHIASVFNRLDLQSYIGTVYLLTATVFLPFFGTVADIYGRHFALQAAIFFFLVGSAISTGAKSMITMLVGRGISGIGAAGMLTVVRVVLSDSRSLRDNAWQHAILFVLYTVGYVTGPLIGGQLLKYSFRWIFAINLPACVVAMALAFFLLRKRAKGRDPTHGQYSHVQRLLLLDWIGTFLFVAAGILILLALNSGSTIGWDDVEVIVSFAVGGVAFALCIGWESVLQRSQRLQSPSRHIALNVVPMLPLDIFASWDVIAVSASAFVGGMILLVMFYFLSIFFTIVDGYSATKAGTDLLLFAPGLGAGSVIGLSIIGVTKQPKYPIILGGIISIVGLGLMSTAVKNDNQSHINWALFTTGLGIGQTIGPSATHARFAQPEHRVSVVTALTLFFRSLGGTIGLAQCSAVLDGRIKAYFQSLVTSGALSPSDAALLHLTSLSLGSIDGINSLSPTLQQIVKTGYQNGTRWAFLSLIPWAGVAFFLTLSLSSIASMDYGARPSKSSVELAAATEKPKDEVTEVTVNAVQNGGSGEEAKSRGEESRASIPRLPEIAAETDGETGGST